MLIQNEVKAIFSRYDFRPLKRFGENYLVDSNIKDKIINTVDPQRDDVILEIGPGLGALTIDLAKSGASVIAVEKDKKAFAILKGLVKDDFPNLKILCGDILEFDLKALGLKKKAKVVGNLPYYITTPIIEYLIENRNFVGTAFITVQKEVAHRFLSDAGSKECGSISCFIRYYTNPVYIHTINRSSFYPVPDVDSAFIRLYFLEKPSVHVKDEKLFFKIVRGAFNQRRKSIINSLSREAVLGLPKEEVSSILNGIGISPTVRPESLGLEEFAKIANAFIAKIDKPC